MDVGTGIAVVALVLSAAGFGVSVWATRISRKSFEHAVRAQESSDAREFDRVRSDLLAQIADGRSTLERARVEIGTLDATFRSEPVEVQRLLVNYTGLFSEHLPRIEASIRQCDELWRDVSTWDGRKRHAELMAARAILHRSLGDDRMAHETAVYLVNQFTAKLESARERVTATRR